MITVNGVAVVLDNKPIVSSVSCALLPGTITLFIGKSGAGKTTLLKSLAGLLRLSNGSIMINGVSIDQLQAYERAQSIGYVFQQFNLFPHCTALENCMDPLLVQGVLDEQAELRACTVLEQLDMSAYAQSYPAQLSGGQQQRVALARALCLQPLVLLLDEPTASLDPINRDILIQILQQRAADGLTIALSTQDMVFARALFDRAYYMQDGKVIEYCDDITNVDKYPHIAQFIAR